MQHSSIGQGRAGDTKSKGSNATANRLADGLGWFSIGLGLTEVVAPGALANLIGIRNESKTRNVLRTYGVREIVAGVGILTTPRPTGWVWGRVAGDLVDLATLGSALPADGVNKTRVTTATAAVLGVTALDVICGQQLSSQAENVGEKDETTVVRAITVDCPPEEAYAFWRQLDNLPRFMTYLKSVSTVGDGRTRWIAHGPAGLDVEWFARITMDTPNKEIAWQVVDGRFKHAGSVRFEQAPGNRGTLVRVAMDFRETGYLASALSGILGSDLGWRISHDLRNFKQVLELGEVTQSDASLHKSMHPARPPEKLPRNAQTEFGIPTAAMERESA